MVFLIAREKIKLNKINAILFHHFKWVWMFCQDIPLVIFFGAPPIASQKFTSPNHQGLHSRGPKHSAASSDGAAPESCKANKICGWSYGWIGLEFTNLQCPVILRDLMWFFGRVVSTEPRCFVTMFQRFTRNVVPWSSCTLQQRGDNNEQTDSMQNRNKNKNDNKMDGMYTEACNKRRSGPWYKPNYRGPACNQKSANWNVLDLAVTRVSALQKELGAMIFFCTLTSWKNVSKKSWLSAKKTTMESSQILYINIYVYLCM